MDYPTAYCRLPALRLAPFGDDSLPSDEEGALPALTRRLVLPAAAVAWKPEHGRRLPSVDQLQFVPVGRGDQWTASFVPSDASDA